jgi:NADH-quinone oxidoreductase subunit N
MAYSAIGHTGFILMLFLLPQDAILKALLFYLLAYILMNAGTFMSFTHLENRFGAITISDYKGLGKKTPFIGALMVVLMVSLTGLPPTAGFIAKFLVFSSLINLASADVFVAALLVIAALTTVVSLFFYLKIPLNFFLKTSENESEEKEGSNYLLLYVSIIAVLILMIGLFPSMVSFG